MSIGYACLILGVWHTDLKICLIKNADRGVAERLDRQVAIAVLKRKLYALPEMYGMDYLLESYYFVKPYDDEQTPAVED